MTKENLEEYVQKKKIVIWGWGQSGQKFYAEYGNQYTDIYFTSSNNQENIDEIPRIEIEKILSDIEDYYIIIGSNSHILISKLLINMGLKPVYNFLFCGFMDAILRNRKIILSVGQCELEITNYIYQNMKYLCNHYYSMHFDEYKVMGIQDVLPEQEIIMIVQEVICLADYFIYPVSLTKARFEYYVQLTKKTSESCKIVSVPLTTFEGYWPQDNAQDYYESCKYYRKNENGVYPFGNRQDRNIEKAIEGGSADTIIDDIRKIDYYSENDVKTNFSRTFKKYRVLEKISDIKISDFLLANYENKLVFRDRGHAEAFVLKEYARRILKYLKIKYDEAELSNVDLSWYDQCHIEFPIYPSVLKYTNISKESYRYLNTYGKTEILNFADYEKKILEYILQNRDAEMEG